MKTVKLTLTLLLALMLLLALAACGSPAGDDVSAGETAEAADTAESEAAGEAEAQEADAAEADDAASEAESAEAQETEEAEETFDGSIELKFADLSVPEGWTATSVSNTEAKLECDEKVPTDDPNFFLKKKMTISSKSSTKTVEEQISDLDSNFGGGSSIDSITIGDVEWSRLIPKDVDDQFYIVAPTTQGTTVKVSGMFVTLDDPDVVSIIEGINIH